ncbi:hypothetical protein EDB87DRAFT_1825815 [Lactarius vividus]|nr:hypothetical protein EDB87DRAFT_1825815 [Lactarius vividus]
MAAGWTKDDGVAMITDRIDNPVGKDGGFRACWYCTTQWSFRCCTNRGIGSYDGGIDRFKESLRKEDTSYVAIKQGVSKEGGCCVVRKCAESLTSIPGMHKKRDWPTYARARRRLRPSGSVRESEPMNGGILARDKARTHNIFRSVFNCPRADDQRIEVSIRDTLHGVPKSVLSRVSVVKGGSAITPEKSSSSHGRARRQQEPNAFEASFMKTVNRHEKEMKIVQVLHQGDLVMEVQANGNERAK